MSGTFGKALPNITVRPPGPEARRLATRLARVESRNVTWLGDREPPFDDAPTFWTEALGANVRDADGNVYIDLTGAFGVAVAGHRHPEIERAIAEQGAKLVHGMGDVHPPEPKLRLLERLAELAPWPETRGFLASSGAEAVEAALKTALLATGRPGILAFDGSYHGLTLGALATTSRADFRLPFTEHLHRCTRFAPFPDLLDFEMGPWEYHDELLDATLRAVEDEIAGAEADGVPLGAIIVEPIQGRAGVRVPIDKFLRELAAIARERDIVLIFDEIFTGFGRTGYVFAFEGDGVTPDLLCVGKALGGGLPLSACLGSAAVMDAAWPPSEGEALHTSTFLGHPLACASALAFLDVLEREQLPERSRKLGYRLLHRIEDALMGVTGVRGIRGGRGAFLGIVLDGPGAPEGAGVRVAEAALRRGVIVLPAGPSGEVVELSPPVVLTDEQADCAVGILAEAVRAVMARS